MPSSEISSTESRYADVCFRREGFIQFTLSPLKWSTNGSSDTKARAVSRRCWMANVEQAVTGGDGGEGGIIFFM